MSWTVIWRAVKLIRILYPITLYVYNAFQVKYPNKMDKRTVAKADQLIIKMASRAGIVIGHTEANLVRSAIHYVKAKSDRYNKLKK